MDLLRVENCSAISSIRKNESNDDVFRCYEGYDGQGKGGEQKENDVIAHNSIKY